MIAPPAPPNRAPLPVSVCITFPIPPPLPAQPAASAAATRAAAIARAGARNLFVAVIANSPMPVIGPTIAGAQFARERYGNPGQRFFLLFALRSPIGLLFAFALLFPLLLGCFFGLLFLLPPSRAS